MFFGIFSNLSPFAKVIFSLFIIFLSLLFTLMIGTIIAIPIFGINFFTNPEILSDIKNPDYIPFFKYFQIVQSVGIFIIPPLIAAKLFNNNKTENYYRFDINPGYIIILLTLIVMFTIQPLINLLIEINNKMVFPESLKNIETWMKQSEQNATELSNSFLIMKSTGAFILNIFMMAIIPAIGEELLFRGLFQRLLKEWTGNIHLSIIITAIAFSAMHLQFYGFIPRCLLGALFGYLLLWTGSIWVPIFAHFINNATAVIISYLSQRGIVDESYESFGNFGNNYIAIILSVIVTVIILYYIFKHREVSSIEIE